MNWTLYLCAISAMSLASYIAYRLADRRREEATALLDAAAEIGRLRRQNQRLLVAWHQSLNKRSQLIEQNRDLSARLCAAEAAVFLREAE